MQHGEHMKGKYEKPGEKRVIELPLTATISACMFLFTIARPLSEISEVHHPKANSCIQRLETYPTRKVILKIYLDGFRFFHSFDT